MEPQPAPQPQVTYVQCPCHQRRRWGFFGALFRFVGFVVVLGLVFAVGIIIGSIGSDGVHFGNWPTDILRSRVADVNGAVRYPFIDGERTFGVIRKIVGNEFALLDNAGELRSVTLSARTVIMDGDREIPAGALRVGQAVRVVGALRERDIVAELVDISR